VIHLPWYVQNALDNRVMIDDNAAKEYWEKRMSDHQKNAADVWIMKQRRDIWDTHKHSPQIWRFCRLIEVLYEEHKESKARKRASSSP